MTHTHTHSASREGHHHHHHTHTPHTHTHIHTPHPSPVRYHKLGLKNLRTALLHFCQLHVCEIATLRRTVEKASFNVDKKQIYCCCQQIESQLAESWIENPSPDQPFDTKLHLHQDTFDTKVHLHQITLTPNYI